MPITGLVNTDVINFANDGTTAIDARPKNYREGILINKPNGSAPLLALSAAMKNKTTDDPEFRWYEKTMPTMRLRLSATITAGVTTIPITNDSFGGANQLVVGTLLFAEGTGEVMRVTAIASATSITVVRGVGNGGTGVAIANISTTNPFLSAIGTALEEGSDSPTERAYQPTLRFNYTQIHRYPIGHTRTAMRTHLRTGDAVKEAKREALEQHSNQIERASFFNAKEEILTGTHPRRTTDGIYNVMATYAAQNMVFNGGAAMNLTTFEEHLYKMFLRGSDQKMAFAGNRALLTINQMLRLATDSPFQFVPNQKEAGMSVNKLVTPYGELVIKRHPLFNDMPDLSATVPGMSSGMVVLDLDALTYRPLRGDDTRYIKDTTDKGIDGVRSEYLTEAGFEIAEPNKHYWIEGLTTAA